MDVTSGHYGLFLTNRPNTTPQNRQKGASVGFVGSVFKEFQIKRLIRRGLCK